MSILVVDDDSDLLDILCFALRRDGYDVMPVHDGMTALSLWEQKSPQLVILDVDIPKVNGLDVCKRIRSQSTTPVIMLSAAGTETDIVKGLEMGADDYVVKPFSPKQFLARVRALLRRTQEPTYQSRRDWQAITAGDLRLDPQWLTVHKNGEAIKLTPTEFKFLYELVIHEGQVLTHQVLTDRVWGYDGVADAGLLKGHIRNLRRKLDDDSTKPVYIHTVPSVGYTFRQRHAPVGTLAGRDR